MNRTIKFRGKRVDNGEWVYGYYVYRTDGSHLIYWKPFDEATQNTYHYVYHETVGQYTGLNDKEGHEIYEGDVLETSDYPCVSEGNINYRHVVEWDNESLMFCCPICRVSDRVIGRACGKTLEEISVSSGLSVAGNIHDNPELLEVNEKQTN